MRCVFFVCEYACDFGNKGRSYGNMKARHGISVVINFIRIEEGERTGNAKDFRGSLQTLVMDLARTCLGLVPASSSSTEPSTMKSSPELSTERKRNGRDLARHKHLKTRGSRFPVRQRRVQAFTSLHVLINLEIHLHNRRRTEGIRDPRYKIRQAGMF